MLQLMAGTDIPIAELGVNLHQPTIKEISFLGEEKYFSALQLLCFNKSIILAANPQGSSALSAMNNFQIFMTLVSDPEVKDVNEKRENILAMFVLLFPGYNATFLPNSIYFNNPDTKHNFTLDENNFELFQTALNSVGGLNNSTGGQNANFNPANKRAAEIAAKLMRGRQKVSTSKGETNDGVLSRYVSILTVGLNSMSLEKCLNLTVYQLYDLIERYGLYVSWDLDIRSRLAGGKPDSKPDDWMKNIH